MGFATDESMVELAAAVQALSEALGGQGGPGDPLGTEVTAEASRALLALIKGQGDVVAANGNIAAINASVEITPAGRDTLVVQVTGTYTGALSLQATIDGVTWVTLGGASRLFNVATSAGAATIASGTQGIFETGISGFTKVRLIALAAVTGSAALSLRAVDGNALVALDASLPAGSSILGAVTQSGTWNIASVTPATPSAYAVTGTASTNAAVVKNVAGTLYGLQVFNPTASPVFVKLYNKATAPLPATDAPVTTIPVPAGGRVSEQLGALGHRFSAGIAATIVGGAAATDATAVAAGVQLTASYA